MAWPESIVRAIQLPSGARFHKCALQVNPFDYVVRHRKPTQFSNEEEYNVGLVEAFSAAGIEVIAVADHYRIRTSVSLIQTARNAGLHVFPGFEAVTKDGVHVLCVFNPDEPLERIERILGDCGIHDAHSESPTGKYDFTELLEQSERWNCVCIAAHVAGEGGLLATLRGQSRIAAWTHPCLFAACLPGTVDSAPSNLKSIIANKDAQHRRARAIAVVNARDISDPTDIHTAASYCLVKMSSVSIEGLRQAFLDPISRIRLATDPEPDMHAEFLAMNWQGGFLDGCAVHFNENLNILIGGRGTGKSTVIESLRAVLGLEPVGEDAGNIHDSMLRQVLRSGTRISLLVRSHRPSTKEYLIERTIPDPPVVRDEIGTVLQLRPGDIIPSAEVYGQHEISEIARSPDRLTSLLDRFVERHPELVRRKEDTRRELERSRSRITEHHNELVQIADGLAALPRLEETSKRFRAAGLEERMREQSQLVVEEGILNTVARRITAIRDLQGEVERGVPIERDFLAEKELADLPNRDLLAESYKILEHLEQGVKQALDVMTQAIDAADQNLCEVRKLWAERRTTGQDKYESILRELQKSGMDGEEFIQLRRQIEELRPLKTRKGELERQLSKLRGRRETLLAEWESIKSEEFRLLDQAARRVSMSLRDRVRVQVSFAGNRDPLFHLLRDRIGGRLTETIEALKSLSAISLREFAGSCRTGSTELVRKYSIPSSQAERIARDPGPISMELEELDLPSTTRIELNTASEGSQPAWHGLDELSTGQKATAVLLLLLLESEAPLAVDQPEDDLDNRFVTEGVVPRMREEKRRRQFIFSTHNANIPVLADAELIVGLEAAGEAGQGQARIREEHIGSIDFKPVRELVEELLEGGKEAFEMRRLKYGF